MPSVVKTDPWWFADPHRAAYVNSALLGPTVPAFWVYNPAHAQVQNEHVTGAAQADIISGGMTPQAAADRAFKRIEVIFAKYPIPQTSKGIRELW
jgi:ABC-type glycerol-3-phosphate transport system substrate-binding protein